MERATMSKNDPINVPSKVERYASLATAHGGKPAYSSVPPRNPDVDDDEEEEDEDGEADDDREPAVIREPDEDE
jgi:hypothetical protein